MLSLHLGNRELEAAVMDYQARVVMTEQRSFIHNIDFLVIFGRDVILLGLKREIRLKRVVITQCRVLSVLSLVVICHGVSIN